MPLLGKMGELVDGMLEKWKRGRGKREEWKGESDVKFHHSIIPLFQHSTLPLFHPSILPLMNSITPSIRSDPHIIKCKGPFVGYLFNLFGHRLSGTMPCLGFNPYQHRIIAFVFFLKGGNIFK